MARTPRPVDPTEGPVQSFAHDLRVLREEAGNPTYRALAKTAGFSATTLGDAAGGVRLPSLEVALAYVGACGGDTEAWRVRWQEISTQAALERGGAEDAAGSLDTPEVAAPVGVGSVDDQDAPAAASIATSDSGNAAPADEDGADVAEVLETVREPGSPTSRSRLRGRPVLAAAGALVLVAAVLAWRLPAMNHSAAPGATNPVLTGSVSGATATAPADCPASSPSPGTFPATTYEQSTKVRTGASTDAAVRSQVPAGCTLRFTGYCLGEVVVSGYSASPDMRWFEVSGGGLISSAILHGDPTPGMVPSACPGEVPAPTAVVLAANPTAAGTVTLQATGTHVWIVGFAAFYPGAPGETAQWHQLTIIDLAAPATVPLLTAAVLGSAAGGTGIPVIADACYGGGSPTSVYTADTLDPANPTALRPLSLSSTDLATAELKACSYPSTN